MSRECNLCHFDNIDSAVKCNNCGAPLETNEELSKNSQLSGPDLVLTDSKSERSIRIPYNLINKEDALIIGREGNIEPEFFSGYKHISRKQCKIIFENCEYYIEHISTATNPTEINNKAISFGIKKIVRDGDLLALADKQFKISICKNIDKINVEQEIISTQEIKYVITCPRCGTEYEVPDINARKDKCEKCDKFNDYYIAEEKAKVKVKNAN